MLYKIKYKNKMKKLIVILILFCASYTMAQEDWSLGTYSFTKTDLLTTVDTLTRHISSTGTSVGTYAKNWYQVMIWTSDTIYVSTSSSFPATNTTTLYPSEYWITEQISVNTSNMYWKSALSGSRVAIPVTIRVRIIYH